MAKTKAFRLKPGSVLADKYEVLDKLGGGWEGEVYHVREIATGIDRAAKLFFPQRNIRNRAAKYHARKFYKLRHCPVLIQYLTMECFDYKGAEIKFLVSELVEGEILKDFVKRQRRKRLTVFEGLHLLHQMVVGLEMIHNARDYHGDLHSENVMVSRRGIGFDIKFVDLYRWDSPTGENIREDVYDIIKVFHEVIGGSRHYKYHPPVVKKICRGLKRSLIYKKFRSAGALRIYLENMSWDA